MSVSRTVSEILSVKEWRDYSSILHHFRDKALVENRDFSYHPYI